METNPKLSKAQPLNQQIVTLFKNKISISVLIILIVIFATSFYFYKVNILDKKAEPKTQTTTLQADAFAMKEPDSLPNTSFNLKYSPIQNTSATPTSSTSISDSAGSEQAIQNYSIILADTKLSFFNYQTKSITSIDEDIDRAKFIDKTRILYLKNKSGIFIYDISDNSKKLVLKSLDPQTLDNIAFIDATNFFFISIQTGKIGFGKIGDTNLRIIDQKLIESSSNYVKTSAYRLPQISPDKKLIAFYDMASNEDNSVKVVIIPIVATNISDKILEINVKNPIGNFDTENALEWSNSSKLLRAGKNSVIDIQKKEVLYKAESSHVLKYFSPDEKSILEINTESGESKITNFFANTNQTFPSNISQVFWIDQNKALLVIIRKVYVFDLEKNSLEKIIDTEDDYKILSSNLIETPTQIIELSKKL